MNPTKPNVRTVEKPVTAVTVGEAAEESRLPVDRILKLLSRRQLFGLKLGAEIYISPAAIPLLEGEVRRLERNGKNKHKEESI